MPLDSVLIHSQYPLKTLALLQSEVATSTRSICQPERKLCPVNRIAAIKNIFKQNSFHAIAIRLAKA